MILSSVTCLKCGHAWSPRKTITRYRRQCPKCKSAQLDVTNQAPQAKSQRETGSIDDGTLATRRNLPVAIYDLMGISGASSPENALQRAFELFRRLAPYKYKHNLESPEAVFDFLEKQAVDGNRKAVEAERRLQDILSDPTTIFYETVGADLAAPEYFEVLKKEGYSAGFLDFLSQTVTKYFEEHGLELAHREN